MKRIACYALHYGAEYLAWSIRSVQDVVDEIVCCYSDRPSFGHETEYECPDSMETLKEEAYRFLTKPLFWHCGRWRNESDHRWEMVRFAKDRGATQVLVVDADELWKPEVADAVLENAAKRAGEARSFRVNFIHFWRSFNWVCRDPAMPTRVLNVADPNLPEAYIDGQTDPVYHFGYAQRSEMVRYKWRIHGHLAEMKEHWFETKFATWRPGDQDVHPTCGIGGDGKGFWNPEPTDPATLAVLKRIAGDHPYFDLPIIP